MRRKTISAAIVANGIPRSIGCMRSDSSKEFRRPDRCAVKMRLSTKLAFFYRDGNLGICRAEFYIVDLVTRQIAETPAAS